MNSIPTFHEIASFLKGTNVHHLNLYDPNLLVGRLEEVNKIIPMEMAAHRRNFYGITLFFKADRTTVQAHTGIYKITENFVTVHSPGVLRKWEKIGDWLGYFIFFKPAVLNVGSGDPYFLSEFPFFKCDQQTIFQTELSEVQALAEVYEKLLYEYNNLKSKNPEIIKFYLQILLQKIKRLFLDQDQRGNGKLLHSRAEIIKNQLLQLMQINQNEQMSLEEYAEQLFISPNYLIRSIKKATGQSPYQLILDFKIQEAEALLLQTDLSVKDIAYLLKFNDPSHFTRVFKKAKKGITPDGYRKKSRR